MARSWISQARPRISQAQAGCLAALKAIKARTIILPVDTDRYFPPVDAEYEARHIPNSACRIVKSAWGHMAPINPGDISGFDSALTELLAG
jgi:homoserine O-acetyltransferase